MITIIARGVPVPQTLSSKIADGLIISPKDKKFNLFSFFKIIFTFPTFYFCHIIYYKKFSNKLLTFRKKLLEITIPRSEGLTTDRKVSVHLPLDAIAATTGEPGKYIDISIGGIAPGVTLTSGMQSEFAKQVADICKDSFPKMAVSVLIEEFNPRRGHFSRS